jgi:hypothetical protein
MVYIFFSLINKATGSVRTMRNKTSVKSSKSNLNMVYRKPVTSTYAGTQELVTISKEIVLQKEAKQGLDHIFGMAMDSQMTLTVVPNKSKTR